MNPVRIISSGIVPGRFYEQPGTEWTPTDRGWDTGHVQFFTHPNTQVSSYPQVGAASSAYPQMYVAEPPHQHDESGLVIINVTYRGVLNASGGGTVFKEWDTPNSDVAMFSLPAKTSSDDDAPKSNLIAPVPKPKLEREFITTVQPTNDGVSQAASGSFLPSLPNFSISFYPDPDQPVTTNYRTGWILDSRTWNAVAAGIARPGIWIVKETYSYYFSVAA